MTATRLGILALFTATALHASQPAPAWTEAGNKNGVALSFRDDPQLRAREVRATAELPHPS